VVESETKWCKRDAEWIKNTVRGGKMFIGEYEHSVDPKGRVIMPSKFREELGSTFYVTKGLEQCLYVYSASEWDKIQQKLNELPITTNPKAGAFVRFFLSGACACEADKQGRILIPNKLKEYAHIDKQVTSIGVSTRVEIWSAERWSEYCNSDNLSPEDMAANMDLIGLKF